MKFKIKEKWVYMICIFLLVFMYSAQQFQDFDYWFHYATGEWIIEKGEIPASAIWSWYGQENNLYWVSHEWLFGLFIYCFTILFGQIGLIFLCPALLALTACLAFNYGFKKWKKNPIVLFVIALCLGSGLSCVCAPRPQLFMYLFNTLLLIILFEEHRRPSNKIFYIIPLTLFWVNMHGGSHSIIFISLFILILSQSFNFKWGRFELKKIDKKITKKRLLVFLLALLTVVINPHGIKMYIYPFSNMTDNVMISSISEWQSLSLNNLTLSGFITVVFTIIFVLLIASNKNKINPFKFVIACMWMFLAFKSIRFGVCFALAMVLILPDYLDVIKPIEIKNIVLTAIITNVALLGACIYRVSDYYNEPFDMSFFPSGEMIQVLQELPEGTHLYNPYNCGGYLVYKHIETFVDGRADIYSAYNLSDYTKINSLSSKPESIIREYNFEYILTEKTNKLDYWIQIQSFYDYEIVYQDTAYILYKLTAK